MSTRSEDIAGMGLTEVTGKIAAGEPFVTAWSIGYITKGGTYVLATAPNMTDSGHPRDLLAILPGDLGKGQVLALYVGVNPLLIGVVESIMHGVR